MSRDRKPPRTSVRTRILDAAARRMFPPDPQGKQVEDELRRMAEGGAT